MQKSIAFIGAGNMATSLIGGLIADGYDPKKIWATNPNPHQLQRLQQRFGINITVNNKEAATNADILVLAVKPQKLKLVVTELADVVKKHHPLIISVVAMIPVGHLEKWLGEKTAIVRCMPNTPSLVQSGASGLFANAYVNEAQKNLAESIMRAVGIIVWVDKEEQMDIVTALSGSGPAYFFYFMEAMQKSAEKLGLPKETAKLLTLQTALGAARLALETAEDLTMLRRQVTSPGGTTERSFEILLQAKLDDWIHQAMSAAKKRAVELADELKE